MLSSIDHRRSSFLRIALVATCLIAGAAPTAAGPYLLVDAQSGRVIAQSDAGRPWHPASVTKLMTTYLVFRAMRDGAIDANTLFEVSDRAAAQPPSKMGFRPGTQITADNAVKMLMVRSANDVAVVIAEGLSGTVEAFVARMNRTASELGMEGTYFANPHGLPDEKQVTTARDMAILARRIIRDFPEYELYFRIPAIQIGKRVIRNHNRLIDRYPGADGMKTGFICSSGFNVVASATRDGKRLIAVVLGSYSAAQRAEDAAKLFERGFSRDASLATLLDNEIANVEAIRNVGGTATDLREYMCNPKRKRPAAESDIDDEDDVDPVADGQAGPKGKKQASLLGPLTASMPPIRVFTGPPSKTPEEAIVTATTKEQDQATPVPLPRPAKAVVAPKSEQRARPKDQPKKTQTAGAGSAGAMKKQPASGVKGAPVSPAAAKK